MNDLMNRSSLPESTEVTVSGANFRFTQKSYIARKNINNDREMLSRSQKIKKGQTFVAQKLTPISQ